jgi:hypothetical protein
LFLDVGYKLTQTMARIVCKSFIWILGKLRHIW